MPHARAVITCCLRALSSALAARPPGRRATRAPSLNHVQHIAAIYADNPQLPQSLWSVSRAEGPADAYSAQYAQRDCDCSLLPMLPPVWQSPATPGATPIADPRFPAPLPNRPFAIDDPKGAHLGLDVPSRDLVHRYYQHIEQIVTAASSTVSRRCPMPAA